MAGPAYLAVNDVNDAIAIIASSVIDEFPTGFLRDEIVSNPFKWSEDVSGGATIFVEVEFITAPVVDTIAILNHNFPEDATFSLKTGDTTAPGVELTTLTWREFDIWQTFVNPNHRFWRLEITLTSPVTPQIGELQIGDRVAFSKRRQFQFTDAVEHTNVQMETMRGVRKSFGLFDRRVVTAEFGSAQLSDLAEFAALDSLVNGSRTPFLWIPDEDLAEALYVRMMGNYTELSVRENEWDVTLEFEEESRGDVIAPLADSA